LRNEVLTKRSFLFDPFGCAADHSAPFCFNDWKRFCFVLREIASGENGCPLSALEAQKRAQAVLAECGYTWLGRIQVRRPVVAPVKRQSAITFSASQRSAPT
jgi:hypothetical protein